MFPPSRLCERFKESSMMLFMYYAYIPTCIINIYICIFLYIYASILCMFKKKKSLNSLKNVRKLKRENTKKTFYSIRNDLLHTFYSIRIKNINTKKHYFISYYFACLSIEYCS